MSVIPDGIGSLEDIDRAHLGLKVGLEIHRQIGDVKLFCLCPGGLRDETLSMVCRKLHLSGSEMGDHDEAAAFESGKGRTAFYEITSNTCPVELDEEPPHPPLDEHIRTSIQIALMLGCDPTDEVQFMRKIVIDGSNPSGFQRTAVIGLLGSVYVDGRKIGIQQISLEEDAGRRIGDREEGPVYRLDRAGTAEVEISTEPTIGTPKEAMEVARRIGEMIKATGKARRGIGTVRQDVNVSIKGGERVEIKLIQDLSTVQKAVRSEALRQLLLLEVRDTLRSRCGDPSSIAGDPMDLTHLFTNTGCKVLANGISKGDVVLGVNLRHFGGLMGARYVPGRTKGEPVNGIDDVRRLGPEFAGRVKVRTGLKGLFHSDELPAYGIEQIEVDKVRGILRLGPDDGFVMVCAPIDRAEVAIQEVVLRAKEAFAGVVPEVRRSLPDGRSEYMRPMPGPARMYPETDIPTIKVDRTWLDRIASSLPEDPLVAIGNLVKRTGLPEESVIQIHGSDCIDLLEALIAEGVDPKTSAFVLLKAASVLGQDLAHELPMTFLARIAFEVREGRVPKEAVEDVLKRAISEDGHPVRDGSMMESILVDRRVSAPDDGELTRFIDDLIRERGDFVSSRGISSVGPLMGIVMKEFRGRIGGEKVNAMLRERILAWIGERH